MGGSEQQLLTSLPLDPRACPKLWFRVRETLLFGSGAMGEPWEALGQIWEGLGNLCDSPWAGESPGRPGRSPSGSSTWRTASRLCAAAR